MEGVFEGGAAVAGLDTVSLAIGQETRAACAIEDYIDGNKESTLAQLPVIFSRDLNTYNKINRDGLKKKRNRSTFDRYAGTKAAEYFKPALYSSCCSDRINVLFYLPSF